MTKLDFKFRAKLWPTMATIVVIITMVSLGNWQISRAQEKEERHEQIGKLSVQPAVLMPTSLVEIEDYKFKQVEARGTFISSHTIYLDNKMYKGAAGYHIVMPLKLTESSMHVLVNRGWVPAGRDRSILPIVTTPTDAVLVTGRAVSVPTKVFALSDEIVAGQVWPNLQLERVQQVTGLDLQPVMILQQDNWSDGLVRQWDRPDSGASSSWSYAAQWYGMALIVMIIYLVLSVKRERPEEK
jgi:surfeit locus 1 family protein